MGYCKICVKSFRIDNSGLSQVKSHANCHKSESVLNNQRKFQVSKSNEFDLSQTCLILNTEDQEDQAEVLQALHFVNKDLSFASTWDGNDQVHSMFSDLTIASCTKCQIQKHSIWLSLVLQII